MTHAAPPSSGPHRPRARGAFTLIELMISIALVLLLILGVNQVFQATSQAVGAGEAISAALRDGRAVQATLNGDFVGAMANGPGQVNGPFLAFRSAAVYAYTDAKDQAADRDSDPTTLDFNGNGIEGEPTVPGEIVYAPTYNARHHRLDTLSLFSRGSFQRQTGNDNQFVANQTAPEAWVWYGHLDLPTNDPATTAGYPSPTFVSPGVGAPATNPNNVFATQFTLGRVAMLLRNPDNQGNIYDNTANGGGPVAQTFVGSVANPWTCPFYPTSPLVKAAVSPAPGFTTANQCRTDLAGNSVAGLRIGLLAYLKASGEGTWWQNLIGLSPTALTAPARFQANPFAVKPITSAAMAQAAPVFVRGCSQFIVEYAGDFVTQDANLTNSTYGNITAAAADGELDYTLVQPPGGGANRATWTKQVKWYGLPRNTSGQPGVSLANGDVAPLHAWLASFSLTSPYVFERFYPADATDYSTLPASTTGFAYQCVFGPNDPAPRLIRITMTVLDPTGRLPDGQTYQFVFPVPPQ